MLSKIETFLNGKKTYIVMIATFLCAGWIALGHAVPDYVWYLLSASGLGAVRSAINNINAPKV